MKTQYVIKNLSTGKLFTGSDWEGAYFSSEGPPRLFDNKEAAIKRLKDEADIFPSQFGGNLYEIVEVYTY
jgi:hypothetical protein